MMCSNVKLPGPKTDVYERCPVLKRLNGPFHACHRGGAAEFGPENTMHNYRRCVNEIRTDMIEIDVRQSKDGKLVIMHDSSVNRTTNGSGNVDNLTFSQLRALDAAYNFSTDGGATFPLRSTGIQIPTVEEVLLEFASNERVVIFFDIKTTGVAQATIDLIMQYHLEHRCMMGAVFPSHNEEVMKVKPPCIPLSADIKTMAKLFFGYKIGLLHRMEFRQEIIGWVYPSKPDFLRRQLTPQLISALKGFAGGRPFAVFGPHLNTFDGQMYALNCGADIVLSDCPDMLRDSIAQFRAQRASGPASREGSIDTEHASLSDGEEIVPQHIIHAAAAAAAQGDDSQVDRLAEQMSAQLLMGVQS